MTRMSREFTLVLLGSGLLTAGYFLWPEDDPAKKAEEAAAKGLGQPEAAQAADNQNRPAHASHHRSGGFLFIPIPGTSGVSNPALARSPAKAGGFGSMGKAVGGGGLS